VTQRTCGSCCCPLAGAHKKPAVRNTSVVRNWWIFIFYEVIYPVSRRLPLLELCLDEGRLGKGNKCDEDGSCMKKRFPLFGFVRGQMSHPTDWSFPVAFRPVCRYDSWVLAVLWVMDWKKPQGPPRPTSGTDQKYRPSLIENTPNTNINPPFLEYKWRNDARCTNLSLPRKPIHTTRHMTLGVVHMYTLRFHRTFRTYISYMSFPSGYTHTYVPEGRIFA
jgi:hypothetical protein